MGRSDDKPMSVVELPAGAQPPACPSPLVGEPQANRNQSWPLSFGQQRLWFLDRLEPESALYNMPCLLRVSGPLNLAALRKAVNALASRHDSLRSRFPAEGEHPRQLIDPAIDIPIEVVDCLDSSAIEPNLKARQLVREEINRPFDLSAGPLLRLMLVRCAADEHLLTVTMHHIVSDEWSLKIIFQELGQLYEQFDSGKAIDLPALPLRYVDYAASQMEQVASPSDAEELAWWKNNLSGARGHTELRTTWPRKAVPSFRGANTSRTLPAELGKQIESAARSERVTPFIILLAAFKALVCRYTGQEDLTLATPMAGRNRIETENLVGFFVNTILLRTDLSANPSFSALVKRVRETLLSAYAHQDVPLERVVRELQPERSLDHLPFTRLMFMAQHDFPQELHWGELKLEFLDAATDTAKCDLTIDVASSPAGLVVRAEYNSDLFDEPTIARLLLHYENILKAIVVRRDTPLSDLPVLDETEARQLIREWNGTRSDYPRELCVHEVFEQIARRTPQAMAIEFDEREMTYQELDERSNQLAHYLRELGVQKGTPVGLCLQRSPDWVIAMVATLKAGGAYVPLDCDYPAQRLAFMLEDTQPPVVLTQTKFLDRVPPTKAKVICVDSDWKTVAKRPTEHLQSLTEPGSLAYVMFTSGSTGRPKGVMVPHRAINRLVLNTNYIDLGPNDRIGQISNVSFDAATFEVWGALLNGGRLVGIATDIALSPRDFAEELRAKKISAMFVTAALFNQIARETPDAFQTAGTVIVGGEALDPKWVRAVLESKPPRRLVNGYGPTENTTFTCCNLITGVDSKSGNIPIGRPISNTEVYILDKHLKPAPIGVPGELYAGGDGLALGYWNRPELTAARFVPNPFAAGPSTPLLYRTGDLARWLPSGEIEFLGRIDDQVKVRGFRIEPGEIETALRSHAKIADCVVRVCGRQADDKRLVAYVAPSNGAIPDAAQLRSFLLERLPQYMVPSTFIEVRRLGLTPNGKLDRAALPEPDEARPKLATELIEPRDEVERKLAGIFQEALNIDRVGIHDRFFDLGGHSLLAVRVICDIEKGFGRKLRVATIFQTQTIAELAAILRQEADESKIVGSTSVVPIQPQGAKPPLFLVHGAGGGMFWGYVNLSKYLGADQPLYGFRSRGLEGREELPTIESIAEAYVQDLRKMQPEGPYYLGGYCFGGNVAYEMARQLSSQGQEVALLVLMNCSPPNSRYTRIQPSLGWAARFLRNSCYWLDYVRRWTPRQRKDFLSWKVQRLSRRLKRWGGRALEDETAVAVGDLVDLSVFPAEERRVWESHIRALVKYEPKGYPGKVCLLRSPGHPLWCSYDEDYGWGDLASGVAVTIVPGAHEKILEEPCVKNVAEEVRKLLALNQRPSRTIETPAPAEPDAGSAHGAAEPIDAVGYWKEKLAGAPALLELPTDFSRPARQTGRSAACEKIVPREIGENVADLAAQLHAREESILIAAVAVLLRRYSRQEDVVIGCYQHAGAHFPLRVLPADDLSFTQLVRRIEQEAADGLKHGAVEWNKVMAELHTVADESYHPFWQAGFRGGAGFSGNAASPDTLDLFFETNADLSKLRITFAESLFEPATINRMLGHWEALLKAVANDASRALAQFKILPPAEEQTVLYDWNKTERPYAVDKTLAQLFLEQARRTPDALALITADRRLTYRELAIRAIAVARSLRELGVEKENLVGVCLERSWEMMASIFGTLLAGAAYVPMDPAYPSDRIGFMMTDAKARVLITRRKLLERLPNVNSDVLSLEDLDWARSANDFTTFVAPDQDATSLAYVIYTSGSTGQPKGVALEHRNAVAFACWAKEIFTPEELQGVLASTSICFDLSIFEMFVPLSWGGCIVLVENALALATSPVANEVRMINTVPSAIRELVRLKAVPASVQVVNLAGEPLATALVNEIYGQTSARKVYDLYGPTETTTYSTFTLREPNRRATIGRPLANEQVYLLDGAMQPVPIGVVGDLYIGGAGVARGYLNRPELTGERFLPNPFRAGERMYKTGDLARWRNDGNLEFLGRSDHQVKIRGFRIELGEIEAILKKQPGVIDAAVVAREDQPGDKRLVAYISTGSKGAEEAEVAKQNATLPPAMIAALRQHLPSYMVPSAFVVLERLPQTPNGKVDRKRLPVPTHDRPTSSHPVAAPRTATESAVLAIWQEVLRTSPIGINDNFFELGGNSLLAIQVISRLRDQFGIAISLTLLFEAPTIEALAAGIDGGKWRDPAAGALPPLAPIPRTGPLPVSPVQERLWVLDQLQPGGDSHHVPAAFRFRGPLDHGKLQQAFDLIVKRHEALRTRFIVQDGILMQTIAPEPHVPIEWLRASPAEARDAGRWLAQQTREMIRKPSDLFAGPLIRARLLSVHENDHVFIVVMHHSISDGWSLDVLFRELRANYQAIDQGLPGAQLPELAIQYADFAEWKRRSLETPVLQADLDYWKRTLAGAPAQLDFPLDFTPSETANPLVEAETFSFDGESVQQIQAICQRDNVTPFMVLLAALTITLRKWTGQEDLVIGTVVAGRSRREIEDLIGCFINFLPLRLAAPATTSATEMIRQVRTAVNEAQDHQNCPFQRIVEAINPERKQNQNPLYNVGLLLQDWTDHYFSIGNIRSEPFPAHLETAVLDLRFEAVQRGPDLSLRCEYRPDMLTLSTMKALAEALRQCLKLMAAAPAAQISDFPEVNTAREAISPAPAIAPVAQSFAISSTFTAEPLAEPLKNWARELGLKARIEFAPYNQVFQQLLDPSSLLARNQQGLNVILLRLDDWQKSPALDGPNAARDGDLQPGEAEGDLHRNAREFVTALRSAAARIAVPTLVCICPSGTDRLANGSGNTRQTERWLAAELKAINGVYTLTQDELFDWYPVEDYYDASANELGHVPYTALFFTALASGIVRRFHALNRPAVKVIALDCDNTLWSGICGEDGSEGLRLEPCRIALHHFMRQQADAGVLLCAVSKNNEQDVREVFRCRKDMVLRSGDFTAWKVNWLPKSENLKALARELKLGLDSFVFVDDNPVECAEVEASCPGVQTLLLPEDPGQIPQFLKHCWIFDHLKLTAEDRSRAEKYRQNQEREKFREQSPSLSDFLGGLELQVAIEPMTPEQLPRVSQLTQRTNQFNCTTRRRGEADIQKLPGSAEILTVSVRDRFGDYGLTGVVIYQSRKSALEVDSFLLSCRVLGRGIEHRMLARLGEIACERGLGWVDVHFTPSAKNRPAHDFLESVGAPFRQACNGGLLFRFPARVAAQICFDPQNQPEDQLAPSADAKGSEFKTKSNGSVSGSIAVKQPLARFRGFREIALRLNCPEKIYQRFESRVAVREGNREGYVAPRDGLEKQLCELWEKLLRVTRVGAKDNFFDLGGHSLMAVRLFSEIEKMTGTKLPLVTIFQSSSVRQLAKVLSREDAGTGSSLLVPIQPKGNRPPLFLVHGAGGDVLWGYANLAAHLPEDQPLYGIKSRAQNRREEFETLEAMAKNYIAEIRTLQPHGPYYIGGYCFGGNVAYEMARQLKSQGEEIALLLLLDSAPANAGYERIVWWKPSYAFRFARNASYWLQDFAALPARDRQRFFARKARSFGRKLLRKLTGRKLAVENVDLEEVIDPEHFPENELKLWKTHLHALEHHIQQPYSGSVVLMRTRGQPLLSSLEADFCWGKLVSGGVDVVLVPGSHENIFMDPHVRALATRLESYLPKPNVGEMAPLICAA